jgi:hypothetical protein
VRAISVRLAGYGECELFMATLNFIFFSQLHQTERKLAEQEGIVSYERHRNTGRNFI